MKHFNSCRELQDDLPWFVNRTLPADMTGAVREHLEHCDACAAEAEWLAEIRSGLTGAAAPVESTEATVRGYEELHGRIERNRTRRDRWQMLVAASALLAVATVVGSLFTSHLLEPRFRTATDAVAPAETVVVEVSFNAGASLSSLRDIMQSTGAVLVDGPSATGSVILELPMDIGDNQQALREQLLEQLRANPAVADVEMITRAARE